MERRRYSHRTIQHKKFYLLTITIILLIINCALLICYLKVYDLLFRPSVHLWVYFVTGVFIVTKIFMIFAFYTNRTLLVDATLFLCVILLIFQFLWSLIASFSVVISADNIADNITAHFPEDEAIRREMKEFEDENNCCFKEPNNTATTYLTPVLNASGTKISLKNDKPSCKSCFQVNGEKARNIAVFLITGYILIFVGLTTIILLVIF